jgi:hypothetical protein
VDLQLAPRTVKAYVSKAKEFHAYLAERSLTEDTVRTDLK